MFRSISIKPLSVAVTTLVLSTSVNAVDFISLGDFNGGIFNSYAAGVSDDGSVVVGRGWGTLGPEAFRWTSSTGMVGLGAFTGGSTTASSASGVSGDGSVIVGSSNGSLGYEAFRWTSSTGMVGLGAFTGGSTTASNASDISGDGSVIVGSSNGSLGYEAFHWTSSGGMEGLGYLVESNQSSSAGDVSNDGSVVVGWSGPASGITEAIRWTASGGMEGLGDLPGGIPGTNEGEINSLASAVSADGSVVVGTGNMDYWDLLLGGHQQDSIKEAFYWTNETGMVGLGNLAGGDLWSTATDVSSDGTVIVGNSASASGDDVFLWTSEGGMESLTSILTAAEIDLTGWTLSNAAAISANGRFIVGSGINPDGFTEAWIADVAVVPVPTAIWLFGSGLIGLVGLARRKKL